MISPTSYDLLQRCRRAWWYRYVGKVPQAGPPHPALALGTAVHGYVERRILDGRWPDATPGEEAAHAQAVRAEGSLAGWLARVGTDHDVEWTVHLDLAPWGGRDTLGGRCDWSGVGPAAWVLDHKTTKNPDYWLTPERLAENVQLLAYAGARFGGGRPGAGVDVTVGHHYIPPAPLPPTILTGLATAAAIDAALTRIAQATHTAFAIREIGAAEEVVPDTSGCYAYGGCPWASVCSAAPADLRPLAQETKPMPLTPQQIALRARFGAAPPAPAPASAEPAEPAEPAEAPAPAPAEPDPIVPDAPRAARRARKPAPAPAPSAPAPAAPAPSAPAAPVSEILVRAGDRISVYRVALSPDAAADALEPAWRESGEVRLPTPTGWVLLSLMDVIAIEIEPQEAP